MPDWLENEEHVTADPINDRNGPILKPEPESPYGKDQPSIRRHDPTMTLRNIELRCRLTTICESPIEIDLGAALIDLAEDRVTIEPQLSLGPYRFDFSVRAKDGGLLCLVECDGKEFHSTPEQIKNDAAKDRFAKSIGVALIRRTGQEIYRDPYQCAASILNEIIR